MTTHTGSRAVSVVVIAAAILYAVTRGLAYLPRLRPDELPGPLIYLTDITGVTPWAVAWLAAAALCLVSLVRRSPVWVAGVVGMSAVWALAFTLGWFAELADGDTPRTWITAAGYWVTGVVLACWIIDRPKKPDPDPGT